MRIHLLGIGGTGMGSLAGLLVEAGHEVTGTDTKIYPPMSDQIAQLGITPFEGYDAKNIDRANPELVVIGNVIRRDNPEAQEVLRRGLHYRSMPQALSELFLADRTPLVIAGTHGKTTAATLAAWLLTSVNEDPGFLIGGVGINFGKSFAAGQGPIFIIEGDEYDTAFFDKGPKFLHYRPQALILTSIEFDHADIYRDVEGITESFRRLVGIMPPDGVIIANADDATVSNIVASAPCPVVTYGLSGKATYRPLNVNVTEAGTDFELAGKGRFSMPLWGEHNLFNVLCVLAALLESGHNPARLAQGLARFKGIRRRQEIIGEVKGVTVIDDFAHHPTAVAKTIESMRMRFPGRRLWAIFEPRSNTSRRNVFQREFARALAGADRVIIASPYRAEEIPRSERLDVGAVADALMRGGVDAHHIGATENILEFVMRGIGAGDVVLIMSNGAFDGLHGKILAALEHHRIFAAHEEIPATKVPRR